MNTNGDDLLHFFDHSIDLLCIADFDGYFKRLNPAWEKTLGYSAAELMARPYVEFLHADDVARTLEEAEKIHEGSDAFRFENRYRCKDGSYRWLRWQATPDTE